MKFLRQNLFYIIAAAIIAVLYLFPSVKLKLKDLFFPVAAIENAITLQDSDLDVQLKGINVASTNLKNFKGNKLSLSANKNPFHSINCNVQNKVLKLIQKVNYENNQISFNYFHFVILLWFICPAHREKVFHYGTGFRYGQTACAERLGICR